MLTTTLFPFLVAFLLPALWSICNVLDQRIANKLHITSIMVLNSCMVMFILLPLFMLIFQPIMPTREQMLILFLIGLCEIFYVVPYYAALRIENTSVIVALFDLGLVMLPVLSFFVIGEVLTPLQYAGFFIVLLASMLVSTKPQRHFHVGPAFWLMLCSAFLSCLASVLIKYATLQMEWDTVYVGVQFSAAATLLLMLLFPRVCRVFVYEVKKHPEVVKYVAGEQTFCAMAETGTYYALANLPVTTVKAIGSLQPFYVLGFTWMLRHHLKDFFTESLEKRAVRRKLAYFGMIIAGLWLVLFAGSYSE